MKKLLIVAMSCVLALGLVGGAFAYFSDDEASTGNTFTAGSMNLLMGDGTDYYDNETFTIVSEDGIAPGDELGPYTVSFQKTGNVDGVVRVNISIDDEADAAASGEFATPDMSAAAFATQLLVTEAYLDADPENKVSYWADQCIAGGTAQDAIDAGEIVEVSPGVYVPTIYGLSTVTLYFYVGGSEVVWGDGDAHSEVFTVVFNANAGNDYQFDGVKIGITAHLIQN